MKNKCPHCGEELEDDVAGREESAAHEKMAGDPEEDFANRLAKAVITEMKRGPGMKKPSGSEDDEERYPA